jgi:superfamily II DNA or RNA helicase
LKPNHTSQVAQPRIGMLAGVRNRRGIVSAVDSFDGPDGRLHLVTVEYTDADSPADDRLLWELEPAATLLEPVALPDPSRDGPMPSRHFDALVRATRWTALSPFIDPDGPDGILRRFPIAAPFHGAIQVDDFQLVPLLKALRMPRVSLLLADDVGLGKTIEAGLILQELILRRRVRRVLILCPASLRGQWRQEMRDKFSLAFDEVDRDATHALRKRLGLDANPWRTFPRIVTSYHYLKQLDVLEEFRAASRAQEDTPHLPWDLLIVDEAHNLTPDPFGDESDLAKMLGFVAPYFEHKLFLTATPHNGHTRSFTGLLEKLDPVRFSQSQKITPAERERIEQVVIRRLKREINARTNPPRFCERSPKEVPVKLSPEERALATAFADFRTKVRSLVASSRRGEQLAGSFAVEVLGKRLLSSPVAFADSWHRYRAGLAQAEAADEGEVRAAARATKEEQSDDREAEGRTAHAAQIVGAWLKPMADRLREECAAVDEALRILGLGDVDTAPAERRPSHDARLEALCDWIDSNLRTRGRFRDDERLIVFTEYKTTQDFLEARLHERYPEDGRILLLYGGMDDIERDPIKAAFNDQRDPVRILLATDAAAEGLNLQETARFLLHFDVPWNPSRIEQRNGRLDRHGQDRDVTAFHFTSDDDADLRFLSYLVGKVDTIREDLGSVGEIFDAAFQRRFVQGEEAEAIRNETEQRVAMTERRADIPREASTSTYEADRRAGGAARDGGASKEAERLDALAAELDLDPETLRDTLEVALGIRVGLPRFEQPDERGRVRFVFPIPAAWNELVDDALRLPGRGGERGPLPALVFDPQCFIHLRNGRPVFRTERDTALLHLGHPLFHRALAAFAQARFPGGEGAATRWTVRRGAVPQGSDALLLLTVEELAVNELRESFHRWVRTICVPIAKNVLDHPLPHAAAATLRVSANPVAERDVARARELWDEIGIDVRNLVRKLAAALSEILRTALAQEGEQARKRETERFQSRQGELSKLIESQTMERLERELTELDAEIRQGSLFDTEGRLQELLRSREAKEEELRRRRNHYEELREQLASERKRVLDHLLPRRYALRGEAQVFPVSIELRLPEIGR